MKVLIIEDEAEIAQLILGYLKNTGFVIEWARDFLEGEDKIHLYEYDVVLLDIGLPGGSGLDLIPLLKNKSSQTGLLIISAKDALDDRVKGLGMGADDYLTKPFHLSELNARIKALIRRQKFKGGNQLVFNELVLDMQSNVLKVNDQLIELTKKEYDLLLYFISNKYRVLTKASIAEHLWGDYMDLADNYDLIYSHIKNIRKKILKKGGQDYIKTIYGMGYKFSDR